MKKVFLIFLFVYSGLLAVENCRCKRPHELIGQTLLNDMSKEDQALFFLNKNILSYLKTEFIFDEFGGVYKDKKKKKEKIAAIFWGLANAAASIAQAANGDPKQGITNFVSTIFNTAAQIAQIEANYTKNSELLPLRNQLIFNLMVNMTEALYGIITLDGGMFLNFTNFPILKELSVILVYTERVSWVAKKILENGFVQMILKEALDYLEIYLHQKVDELMEYLKDQLVISKVQIV